MKPEEARKRIEQLAPRLGLEIHELQKGDIELINLLVVPALTELGNLMSRAAEAIRSKNIYQQGLAFNELKNAFTSQGVMIQQVDEVVNDNLATLQVDGPYWVLKVSEQISIPSSVALEELIHELGAFTMIKILMKHVALENPEHPTSQDVLLLKQLLTLPTATRLDQERKKVRLSATHLIDGVFKEMAGK